jgi:hypothetical protein
LEGPQSLQSILSPYYWAQLLSACALAPKYQPSTAASESGNQVTAEASPGISEATVESEEPKSNATPPAIESSPESLP